jgi:SAM-dependent methyltransferase
MGAVTGNERDADSADAQGRSGFRSHVLDSVAAYDEHLDAYTHANAQAMEGEVGRFCELVRAAALPGPVLDAGCGPGRDLTRFAAAGVGSVGVDMSASFCRAAAMAAPVARGDLCQLPFADAAFAGVWACASLVHLDERAAATALVELARVAAVGAPVFVSVKSWSHPDGWVDTAHGRRWFRSWSPDELCRAMGESGFSVMSTSRSGGFVDVWAQRG